MTSAALGTDCLKDVIAPRNVAELAATMAARLSARDCKDLRMLSIGQLAEITGTRGALADLLAAAEILCLPKIGILTMFGMIFDADGQEHALEDEDFSEFRRSGVAVHPHWGTILPAERVQIFYDASSSVS